MLGKLVTKRYTAGPASEKRALCCYRLCDGFVSKIHHHRWADAPAHTPGSALKGATRAIHTHSARIQAADSRTKCTEQ